MARRRLTLLEANVDEPGGGVGVVIGPAMPVEAFCKGSSIVGGCAIG